LPVLHEAIFNKAKTGDHSIANHAIDEYSVHFMLASTITDSSRHEEGIYFFQYGSERTVAKRLLKLKASLPEKQFVPQTYQDVLNCRKDIVEGLGILSDSLATAAASGEVGASAVKRFANLKISKLIEIWQNCSTNILYCYNYQFLLLPTLEDRARTVEAFKRLLAELPQDDSDTKRLQDNLEKMIATLEAV